MKQLGFLDFDIRLDRINKAGDALLQLREAIDWEVFRPTLEKARQKPRKSSAGAKGFDVIMLFKILILQSLYNLSDDAMGYQILDRYSFSRFLGLHAASKVPDATTIWRFREDLTKAGKVSELFSTFDNFLSAQGYQARKGQIVDASIVRVPLQRNSRDENQQIKDGKQPEGWSESKQRQKDTDARWIRKNHRNYYGYKNHISVDVKHKLIRAYVVTCANVHDSNVFQELLDPHNSSKDIWADSAYRSQQALENLEEQVYREHLQRKGSRHCKLTKWEQQGNRTRSRIRSRVEHIFGVQAQRAGNNILRGIGIVRSRTKIGLRNLAYNLDRFGTLRFANG